MAGSTRIFPQIFKPGIKRDGTEIEGHFYTDGEWCRFERGLPRKMGGFLRTNGFTGPVRQAFMHARDGVFDIYGFSANSCEYLQADYAGGYSSVLTRAFDAAFTNNVNNTWQVDIMFDSAGGGQHTIIAHGAPNRLNIDSETAGLVQYGEANDPTAAFVDNGSTFSVCGGIVVLHPYLFAFCKNGLVFWSNAGEPLNIGSGATGDAGNANISGSKIVAGRRVRGGGGNAPSGLFWSLDELIRASYVGGSAIFRFDTISSQSSVMGQHCMVEYDGMYFWPGLDRFLMYNGVVRELPNDLNADDFFENINIEYRNLVWGTKVPRYGEIWWFYPRGDATECNAAVIYNVVQNTWYDPGRNVRPAKRSAGLKNNVFQYPAWFDSQPNADDKYDLYFHERGVDEVDGSTVNAVKSSFTTADFGLASTNVSGQWSGMDVTTRLRKFEPDIVQSGDLKMTALTRKRPQSADSEKVYNVAESADKVDTDVNGRIIRLKFESNEAGGNYQFGQSMLHLEPGDGRP